MQIAIACRYGHQDLGHLLGRDMSKYPLTPLELALFNKALEIHVQAEFGAKDPLLHMNRGE